MSSFACVCIFCLYYLVYFYRPYKDYLEVLFLWEVLYFHICMVNIHSKGKDQPGKVVNPARGQLNNRKNDFSLFPFAPENLVSGDEFSRPVPRQPAHLHTQAESGACLSGFLPCSAVASIYLFNPTYAIGSVPSLSGRAIAYRWCSLPRVRRPRASKPQGSSEQALPWHITVDPIICASLSRTHYLYEVGMLKVPYILLQPPLTPS